MTPARHSATRDAFYASYDHYQDVANFDVVPEQRIGRPLSNRAGRTILKLGVFALILAAGAWLVRDNPTILETLSKEISRLKIAALTPQAETKSSAPTAPRLISPLNPTPPAETATQPEALAPQPPAPLQIITANAQEPASPPAPTPSASSEGTTGTPYAAPPPPPTDPNRKKAEAVGLHPDISAALLARLTAADFRNARLAIDTALAETADDGIYVRPSKRTRGLALFKVHFVPGAGQNCRRYVVTIAKDGWLTTALPMERCGVHRRTAQNGNRGNRRSSQTASIP
jgi:hypothetical protein